MNNLEFQDKFEKYPIKRKYIRMILYTFDEKETIGEIQGRVLSGSISVDGSSAIRRTVNFTAMLEKKDLDLQNIDNLISINKKFLLEIGVENFIDEEQDNIIWFRQGIFLVSQCSMSFAPDNITVSVTAKDKMVQLNGEVGGMLPASTVFHEKYAYVYSEENPEEIIDTEVTYPTIYQIVQESVNHFGKVDLNNIILDIPLQARELIEYRGKEPIFFETQGGVFTGNYTYTRGFYRECQEYSYGDCIGYRAIDFRYPDELILSAGETICDLLDKIVEALGNYEYFFDINGNFVFQEQKNNLINPKITSIIEENEEKFYSDFSEPRIVYNFNEANLQSAFTVNPNYENVKNDFIVWGTRKVKSEKETTEVGVWYHVAIDDKPGLSPGITEWREELYQQGKHSEINNIDSNYYWTELAANWRNLYDPENSDYIATNNWNPDVIYHPDKVNYFLDLLSTGSTVGKFSVNAIGRRTKVVNDDNVDTVFHRAVPDIIFIKTKEEEEKCILRNQAFSYIDDYLDSIIQVSGQRKSAFEVMREMIYQHTFYNDTITITAAPIYDLEPNVRVSVDYSPANIHGSYIIKTISLPLEYNGMMTVTLNKALELI